MSRNYSLQCKKARDKTILIKNSKSVSETGSSAASTISPKNDLSLLGVNLDAMVRDSLPDMDSNDVDEIFKGVLTDDSQVIISHLLFTKEN